MPKGNNLTQHMMVYMCQILGYKIEMWHSLFTEHLCSWNMATLTYDVYTNDLGTRDFKLFPNSVITLRHYSIKI